MCDRFLASGALDNPVGYGGCLPSVGIAVDTLSTLGSLFLGSVTYNLENAGFYKIRVQLYKIQVNFSKF